MLWSQEKYCRLLVRKCLSHSCDFRTRPSAKTSPLVRNSLLSTLVMLYIISYNHNQKQKVHVQKVKHAIRQLKAHVHFTFEAQSLDRPFCHLWSQEKYCTLLVRKCLSHSCNIATRVKFVTFYPCNIILFHQPHYRRQNTILNKAFFAAALYESFHHLHTLQFVQIQREKDTIQLAYENAEVAIKKLNDSLKKTKVSAVELLQKDLQKRWDIIKSKYKVR